MELKKEVIEMKNELNQIKNDGFNPLYRELVGDLRKASKRNFIIIVILLVMLFATNLAWVIYEIQFQTITEESIQETYYTEDSNITQSIN